jgi:hypothetical protein
MLLAGCSAKPPQITVVEGVILLEGEPLPLAQVQFIPELQHFGAEYNASAVTDDQGRFKMKCHKNGEPGAVVGWNRVVVTDYAPPDLRRKSQEERADYYLELKNRPIPDTYASVGKTPLRIEVSADQSDYRLELKRPTEKDK